MMRQSKLVLAVALLAGVGGVVASAAEPLGVASELQRTANTTPEQKKGYVDAAKKEIAEAQETIQKLLQAAENASASTEAIQCLNQKKADVSMLSDVVSEAEAMMLEALEFREEPRAAHAVRQVAIALTSTRSKIGEAYSCTGEETVESGVTTIDYTAPDDLAETFDNPDDAFDAVVDLPGEPGAETPVL